MTGHLLFWLRLEAALCRRLPEPISEVLTHTERRIADSLAKLEKAEKKADEFERHANDIYRLLKEQSKRQSAYHLFGHMSKNTDFQNWRGFERLKAIVEGEQFADLVSDAKSAIKNGRIYEAIQCLTRAREIGPFEFNNDRTIQANIEAMVVSETGKARTLLEDSNLIQARLTLKPLGDLYEAFPSFCPQAFTQAKILAKEVEGLDDVEKELNQAKSYIVKGRNIDEIDQLLKKIINLEYSCAPAEHLKTEAALLLARLNPHDLNYDVLEDRLHLLAIQNPTDVRIQSIYERYQIHRKTNQEKEQEIRELHMRGRIWFWASLVTAVTLLSISIYIILTTVNKGNPLSSLTALSSIIPVLATKLVYDQSTKADTLANKLYEEMMRAENDLFDRIQKL
jgi:hypothetical protein